MVTLSVTIATGSSEKLSKLDDAAAVAAAVAELEKAGSLTHISRLKFSTLEEQQVQFQFGETASVITGRTFGPFGGRNPPPGGPGGPQSVANYVREQTGTLVTATARVADSGVVAELAVEQTRFDKAKPAEENELNVAPPAKGMLVAKATLMIPPDVPVLLGGFSTTTDGGTDTTVVLVTAKASDRPVAAEAAVGAPLRIIQVYALRHVDAEGLRKTLTDLFSQGNFDLAVDARTNSVLIRADAETLEVVEAIIRRLDEDAGAR